jgi:hypothetical protein
MPDVEHLVEQAKSKLSAAGSATAKDLSAKLDEKLATLKTKLDTLTKSAAAATQQMKDDVVAAFGDLVTQLKSSLA